LESSHLASQRMGVGYKLTPFLTAMKLMAGISNTSPSSVSRSQP
jgi:hypothetical protein